MLSPGIANSGADPFGILARAAASMSYSPTVGLDVAAGCGCSCGSDSSNGLLLLLLPPLLLLLHRRVPVFPIGVTTRRENDVVDGTSNRAATMAADGCRDMSQVVRDGWEVGL